MMAEGDKAVLRFLDGSVLKGHLTAFSEEAAVITLCEADNDTVHTVNADILKAIFFVKTFEGKKEHHDKKSYVARKPGYRRTFIKFNDGEDMVGFLEGDVPWDKGFFLSRQNMRKVKGFYLRPSDEGSNNIKVFVFTKAVRDVTVIP
jgi:hypothetical protein